MAPIVKKGWFAVSAIPLIFVATFYFCASAPDPAANIKEIAIKQIARQTSMPLETWTVRSCEFDGTIWHVEAIATVGGVVSVTVTPAGYVSPVVPLPPEQ